MSHDLSTDVPSLGTPSSDVDGCFMCWVFKVIGSSAPTPPEEHP